MNFKITAADIDCASGIASFIEKFHPDRQTEKYEARILNPDNRILVAKIDDEIVGVIGAKPNLLEPRDYQQIIFGLYVSPDHERQGIGSALLHQLFKNLQEACIKTVIVFTFAENLPAQWLYEAFGGYLLPYVDSDSLDLKIPHVSYGFRLE